MLGGIRPKHLPALKEYGFGYAFLGYIWQGATPGELVAYAGNNKIQPINRRKTVRKIGLTTTILMYLRYQHQTLRGGGAGKVEYRIGQSHDNRPSVRGCDRQITGNIEYIII